MHHKVTLEWAAAKGKLSLKGINSAHRKKTRETNRVTQTVRRENDILRLQVDQEEGKQVVLLYPFFPRHTGLRITGAQWSKQILQSNTVFYSTENA